MFTLQNSEACRGVSNLLQQVASCFAAWRIPLIVDVSFLHMSYLLYKIVQVFTADKLVFPRYTHQEKTSCMVVHSISSSSAQGRGLLKTWGADAQWSSWYNSTQYGNTLLLTQSMARTLTSVNETTRWAQREKISVHLTTCLQNVYRTAVTCHLVLLAVRVIPIHLYLLYSVATSYTIKYLQSPPIKSRPYLSFPLVTPTSTGTRHVQEQAEVLPTLILPIS